VGLKDFLSFQLPRTKILVWRTRNWVDIGIYPIKSLNNRLTTIRANSEGRIMALALKAGSGNRSLIAKYPRLRPK
jgi:hypothetical protein